MMVIGLILYVPDMAEFLSLAWDKLTPDKYDEADNDGDTALHIWAKSKKNSKPHGIVSRFCFIYNKTISFLCCSEN